MIHKTLPCLVLLLGLALTKGYGQCSYTFQPDSSNGIDAVCHRHPLCDIPGNPCDTTVRNNSKHIYATAREKGGITKKIRSFIKFDLDHFGKVDPTALPNKVTLDLYFYRNASKDDQHITTGGSNAFYIERIIERWDDDTLRWQYPVSSGNERMPTVAFGAGSRNRLLIPATTSNTQDVTIDMTEMVSFWLARPDSNFGFRIRLADETPERQVHFCSSNYPDAQFRPKLSIDFPKVVAGAGKDLLICQGTTGRLNASGGASYVWYPLAASNDVLSKYDVKEPFLSATKQQSFEVEASIGSCTDRDTVFIDFGIPKPASITSPTTDDITICRGKPVQFAASGGTFFRWLPLALFGSDTTSPNPTATPLTSTRVYVEVLSAGEKCPGLDSVDIRVLRNIDGWVRDSNKTICDGDSAKLEAFGGVDYKWSPANQWGDSTGSSIYVAPTTTQEYVVEIGGVNACPDTDTILVEVVKSVSIDAGEDDTICAGDTLTFKVAGTGTFVWNNTQSLSDPLSGETKAYPSVTTEYIVKLFDGGTSCEGIDTITITVDPVPTITTNITDTTICADEEVTLTATGADTWSWSVGNETSDKIIIRIEDVNVDSVIRVQGITGRCTSATTAIRLKTLRCTDPYVIIPKYFSPNGDGIKDRFVVEDIERYDNEVIIINKWGDIVYRADNYNNRWDGTYYGQDMAEDTYMYVVRVNVDDEWINYRGTVTILRGKR